MNKLFSILFLLAALIACTDDFTKIGNKGIIPKDKFVDILVGVHMMDVLANGPSFSRKYEPGDSIFLNQAVFDKYNVTKEDFDSTVAMYIRQPEVYIKIYDEVLLKMNFMLDTLKKNVPKFTNEAIEE